MVFCKGLAGGKVENLKNNNWHIHQNDPDNWIRIPDFNVIPKEVKFEGFAFPILLPTTERLQVSYHVWQIVKLVRGEAKKRFNSLADLKFSHNNLLERCGFFDKEFTQETYSNDELFAYRYESIFNNLERCLHCYKNNKIHSINALAQASVDLAEMLIEKPIDEETEREIRSLLAKNAAHARHSEHREMKSQVFKWCDENMARFKSMDDAAFDISGTFIPQKFRTVREWMTEWKKLRSASTP